MDNKCFIYYICMQKKYWEKKKINNIKFNIQI